MSDQETENSYRSSVTSEDVARQMKAVIDPVTQLMERLSDLMREF